jgi:hypothetical protein
MTDPSQKARVLGEAISDAMNMAAFAILAFLAPVVVSLAVLHLTPKLDEPSDPPRRP